MGLFVSCRGYSRVVAALQMGTKGPTAEI